MADTRLTAWVIAWKPTRGRWQIMEYTTARTRKAAIGKYGTRAMYERDRNAGKVRAVKVMITATGLPHD